MKTVEERRDAFRVAMNYLVTTVTTDHEYVEKDAPSARDKVDGLFTAELEAAEEVRVLDRIEQKAYTANQVLFNTDCGEDMADVRKAAAAVLEKYLADGEGT